MVIVLTILKVLGIAILVSALLLLILVLLVLFVPVRYDLSGEVRDPDGSGELFHLDLNRDLSMALDIQWLLGAVHATGSAGREAKGPEFSLRLFGLRVPVEKFLHRGGKKKKEEPKPPAPQQKRSLEERIEQVLNRIERVWRRLEDAKHVLGSRCGIRAREVVTDRLLRLLDKVLPEHWGLAGVLGLGDPARSARVLAVQGFLYPVTAGHVQIGTEYELYRYDLAGAARGRVRLVSFASAGLGILLNKDVRKVLKRLRRGPAPSNGKNGNKENNGHRHRSAESSPA